MATQPFYGELFIEDPHLGKQMLYVHVGASAYGETVVELHNASPPNSINTLIGRYGDSWLLKRVKTGLLVTVYELTFLEETPPVRARCVTGHKCGRMIEDAIKTLKL
jgi:hypothetical protein